jgi:hypothetical protein
MGPLSYMRSVVDRNVIMRRIPVHQNARTECGKTEFSTLRGVKVARTLGHNNRKSTNTVSDRRNRVVWVERYPVIFQTTANLAAVIWSKSKKMQSRYNEESLVSSNQPAT